jgi:hypothetical protein
MGDCRTNDMKHADTINEIQQESITGSDFTGSDARATPS